MPQIDWKLGDRVIHAGRPEWGAGEVRSAEAITQDGRKSQRVTVRFERAGVKVLSTAFADLRPADVPLPPARTEAGEEPEVSQGDRVELVRNLSELPEAAIDPFRTRRARLETSLALYRFAGTGSSLLDWAASQSGLKDPLSSFSRPDLEQAFERFRFNLDGHIRKLAYELKKEDPAALVALAAAAIPAAKLALKRADAGR